MEGAEEGTGSREEECNVRSWISRMAMHTATQFRYLTCVATCVDKRKAVLELSFFRLSFMCEETLAGVSPTGRGKAESRRRNGRICHGKIARC